MNRTTAAILAVPALVLGVAVLVRVKLAVPWAVMMSDTVSVTGAPFYAGFVSNVGILLWAATAGIFLFTYGVLRTSDRDALLCRFLLASGIFVAWLGLDDLFLLHEMVLPNRLGIPQLLVVAGYGLAALAYLAGFARVIARTEYPLFLAALGLLGSSVALDQLSDLIGIEYVGKGFLEDAPKLLGVGAWLAYAIHTCTAALAAPVATRTNKEPFWGKMN